MRCYFSVLWLALKLLAASTWAGPSQRTGYTSRMNLSRSIIPPGPDSEWQVTRAQRVML